MRRSLAAAAALSLCPASLSAAQESAPALTLYNQRFAVVRVTIPLDLKAGETRLTTAEMTAHLEPSSVILRDPTAKHGFRILEQTYRNDPVSPELLLQLFEGKTIDFETFRDNQRVIVPGRIVRSGYQPHSNAFSRYGNNYYMTQMATANSAQPIIEVEGQLRFGLPGQPLFPSLADDTTLKPRIEWVLASTDAAAFDAELAYVSGGFTWAADYNVIAPEKGDVADVIGWVTMDNQSGTTFRDARVKLMAGDVNKLQDGMDDSGMRSERLGWAAESSVAPVTEKAFDEFHLYTLARPTTLRDRETKQVEFVRATGVKSQRFYVYDGAQIGGSRYRGWNQQSIRENPEYGSESNPKVFTMLEIDNREANGLGMPLPRGKLRFYRRDSDGRLEFTGEDRIDHTPKDEKIRVYMGNSFDLTGERVRTDFNIDNSKDVLDETFRITLRNHKSEPVEVRVVEHLYRWVNWEVRQNSDSFLKTDAQTVEFRVSIPKDGEKVVTYTAHYWW